MLPEGQSDYECFVSDIRKDFELRVETVQTSAEENTKGILDNVCILCSLYTCTYILTGVFFNVIIIIINL